jgi:hypothetical protein
MRVKSQIRQRALTNAANAHVQIIRDTQAKPQIIR